MDAGLLRDLQQIIDAKEDNWLSPLAVRSREAVRRKPEEMLDYRQPFAQDADRILHSKSYSRYIDKTQVFSLVANDHITHRVLHVQLVSRIARTIGRYLGLNEDLIEAIALGHDLGHPPFGHEGERILSRLCRTHGLDSFQHNIQSVQFLDTIERKGRGWNLTLQVLDGILCHDGEAHSTMLSPKRAKDFVGLEHEIKRKAADPMYRLTPMTLEGCVVRLADTIGYIGRDIEDAIELGLITRDAIPVSCREELGSTNGTIVYTLVTDCITQSSKVRSDDAAQGSAADKIGFSSERGQVLLELKKFNYEQIYHNPLFRPDFNKIAVCYEALFAYYLNKLDKGEENSEICIFTAKMSEAYRNSHQHAAMVRDFIAGMTDEYFLRRAGEIGCDVPERTCEIN